MEVSASHFTLVALLLLVCLAQVERKGLVSISACGELLQRHQSLGQNLTEEIADLHAESGFLAQEELRVADRRCLLVARSTLQDLLRQGLISDDVFRRVVSDIDAELRQVG